MRHTPYEQRGPEMFDYATIKQQVTDYVSEHEQDYDLDGIMDELRERYDWITDVDDVDQDDFLDIIERHDVSEQ